MQNHVQKERSLKKLHFCIANYMPTHEEISSLTMSQLQLQAKIEMKFKKAEINKRYAFPRRFYHKEIYTNEAEVVDLHDQKQAINDQENVEVKQKPKIKLGRVKIEKRIQTQQYEKVYEEEKSKRNEALLNEKKFQPLQQIRNNKNITQTLKERIKTQYSHKGPEFSQQNASSKLQNQLFLNKFSKEKLSSQSKSKLNMLTKSYINMKSSLKNSGSKIPISTPLTHNLNNIRSNDYKFMPTATPLSLNTINFDQKQTSIKQTSDLDKYKMNKLNLWNFRSNEDEYDKKLECYERKYVKNG